MTEEEVATIEVEVEDDDESLPFPRARIVNLMRDEIGNAKQIRSEVKDAMNLWLGNLLKTISREMGSTQFGSVGMADFQRATRPYDMIGEIVEDEERLKISAQKLKMDSEHIIREFERFFSRIKGERSQPITHQQPISQS